VGTDPGESASSPPSSLLGPHRLVGEGQQQTIE